MEHREGTFRGRGGLGIHWQAWRDDARIRAAVVISHGAAEHSGRYRHVVERLVPDGYAIAALDHRGHGRSQGRRAVIDRWANAVADLDTFVDRARDERPDIPLFLLGHSLGGAIALSYALEHQDKLDGLIVSAPAAALEAASPVVRLASKVLSAVVPTLGVFAVDPAAISRDEREVDAYATDPLVHHGKLPARTVAEVAAAIEGYPSRVHVLELPLLVMHGTADRLAPLAGTQMIHAGARSADKQVELYDGFYHEIFNELPEDRERVLDDLAAWLAAHS